jgi:predicted O-linked N-acetylglucosamine transferase (SPINDLY family)
MTAMTTFPPQQPVQTDLAAIAARALDQAALGSMSVLDVLGAAQTLQEARHPEAAIDLYRTWLAHTPSPVAYAVQFNLGVLLAAAGDDASAEQCYRAALAQKPGFIEGLLNLGTLLERQGRPEEALAMWQLVPGHVNMEAPNDRNYCVQALNNLGRLLEIRKQFTEAEAMLMRSLELNPAQPNVMTHWVHLRQKQCKWPVYDSSIGISHDDMIAGTSALAMLSASDDPALQLATARRYVSDKVLKDVPHLTQRQSYGHERLRIGYLSSDFCSHAVSILTAELYGLHDRSKVEVFGFCWSHEDGSPLRARVIAGMDHHIRIGALSDEEAAHLIRSHEIDILVDLHGLTLGTRHNILAYRPAPLQITWLGFPGPTALPEIDYVITDPFVLPPELEPFFSEKPLHMPQCFQINDRERLIGPRPSRQDCGLPEDAFVFCCFNNNFKFSPEVFGAWLRILQRVPGSVLWIVADSEVVRQNLLTEAGRHGVDAGRIYFAGRVPPAEYLARFQAADLFLDTYPFGAGTTASDALWAGLPLLTYAGRVFASRMAGSLLQAVELPELITFSLEEYEHRAVALATNPALIEAMKRQLADKRMSCTLFDTPRFVRDLEALYRKAVDALPRPALPAQSAHPASSATGSLDYLEAPYGTPNLDKAQDPNGRRYVIVAPPYQHNSAGIRVLYDLQKWLVRAGLDAIVCTWFNGYPVEQFEDDIVIYPEVAPGNLLKAKRVIRYILNVPGKLGYGEKAYDPSEVLVAYNKELAHYAGGRMLQVPSIEPFFHADATIKICDAVFVGKGRDLGLHPAHCVAITKAYPATRKELAQLLRSAKTLYMYDDFSMISHEAVLCGCDVKLIRADGAIIDYPHHSWPTLEEFKVQLDDFIRLSKTL